MERKVGADPRGRPGSPAVAAMPAGWVARLSQRADAPPARPREALRAPAASAPIGSIEPELARRIADAGLPLRRSADGWMVDAGPGAFDAALQRIARWLSAQVLHGRWRDEALAVTDDTGQVLGAIERAAVRVLGITTHAVHLVGHTAAGAVWAQQRAFDKATDPGLWDTLMGGQMAAGESVEQTLERETWEEAGLRLDQLQAVRAFGRLTVRRPVPEGYMVEHIHLFEARVPAGIQPVNRDGEVVRFECLDLPALRQRLGEDAFTLEAALILQRWLDRGAG